MKKALIFYYSKHHGNTRKLVEAAAARCGAELIALPCAEAPDIAEYDWIGFASGIYMSDFGQPVYELIGKLQNLTGKACFIAYTSGSGDGKYAQKLEEQLSERGARVAGQFHCKGYDTFGPFRLIGGIAKGHPNETDLDAFIRFLEALPST